MIFAIETLRSRAGQGLNTTAWLPTPRELAALNAGAAVHVRVLGSVHPPMMVEVGEVPE